jgi:hypothetical protein
VELKQAPPSGVVFSPIFFLLKNTLKRLTITSEPVPIVFVEYLKLQDLQQRSRKKLHLKGQLLWSAQDPRRSHRQPITSQAHWMGQTKERRRQKDVSLRLDGGMKGKSVVLAGLKESR